MNIVKGISLKYSMKINDTFLSFQISILFRILNRKARSDRDVLTYAPVRGGGEPIVLPM